MKSLLTLLFLTLLFISCTTNKKSQPVFEHDIKNGPTPWTSDTFELEEDDFTSWSLPADLGPRILFCEFYEFFLCVSDSSFSIDLIFRMINFSSLFTFLVDFGSFV